MTSANVKEENVECRLCGKLTHPSNIRKEMKDQIKGFVSFKDFVEYLCRIELIENDKLDLPQGACDECYNTLIKFCMFSVSVEKQQNLLNNRLPKSSSYADNDRKEEKKAQPPVSAKRQRTSSTGNTSTSTIESERSEKSDFDGLASPNRKSQRTRKAAVYEQAIEELKSNDDNHNSTANNSSGSSSSSFGKMRTDHTIKRCLNEVYELFKDDLSEREKSFEKITIKEKLLLDGGEIPKDWLRRYNNFVTWQDLPHECNHCNQKFKSLGDLLMHFDKEQIPFHKRVIKCTKCDAIFKDSRYIVGYVNHVDRQHYNHLKFGCIFCGKIFYNVVKLCEHGVKSHGDLKFKYYICYDCGLMTHTMDSLKQHKTCHEV